MMSVLSAMIDLLTSPVNLFFMFLGTTLGILVGAIPGMSGSMAIALLIPITYVMDPIIAFSMIAGIYNGSIFGGAISAIMLKIPGTGAAVATVWDGYEMTKHGEAGRALEVACSGSAFGGIFSVMCLALLAPPLSKVALMFGPSEYFWAAFLGLTLMITLASNNMIKGLSAGAFGIWLATIGLDPLTATSRFTFGQMHLLGGIPLVPFLIGLFALPQSFELLQKSRQKITIIENDNQKNKKYRLFGEFKELWKTYIKSSIIGTIVGIIPAAGGNIGALVSYTEAKRTSKHSESFGTGISEGVLAAETANNAVTGGALVPLLTLGVPGSVASAIMVGAFLVHGMEVGPMLFIKHPRVVNDFIAALLITNIMMLFIGYYFSKPIAKIAEVPNNILAPIIIMVCVIGTYSMRNYFFDVALLIIFGVIGYYLKRYNFPLGPIVLGFILGPIAETNFLRALTIGQGNLLILFKGPISLLLLSVSILSIIGPIYKQKQTIKNYRRC